MGSVPRSRTSPTSALPRRVGLTLIVLLAAACSGRDGGATGPSATPGVRALLVAADAGLPDTVDELPAADVDAFRALLDAVRGTPLVVNVWASWCEPCLRETPILAEAARATPDVQFLGIDVLDTRTGASEFVAEHGVPYPSLFDASGAILTDLGGLGPPVTAFYAADGTLSELVRGEISASELRDALAEIVPAP
jgi:cytochrome c biogenesis protein CcmG, thiol:disulfide interchange protein DsbE